MSINEDLILRGNIQGEDYDFYTWQIANKDLLAQRIFDNVNLKNLVLIIPRENFVRGMEYRLTLTVKAKRG